MPRRLLVIDGADKGQSYLLPEAGAVLIGNSRKHTDICLHDLFVARVHCQVEVDEDRITVCDRVTPNGILVNGTKVPQRELQLGDVIRVGNSYLRLEDVVAEPTAETDATGETAAQTADEPGKLPNLPPHRLGELAGRTLAHYKIGAEIAQGYSGAVFRARDLKTDEAVALKVLSPVFPADMDEMQRFIRAMKAWLPVQHAGVVTLRGVGKTGPYVWIATEYVDGEGLGSVIRRLRTVRKIPWQLAVQAARQIARALHLIHRQHLVHANITPANILQDGAGKQYRLNDLGLWDALAGCELRKQTHDRKFQAELPYLSPEHTEPDRPLDDLSDQYCLGAVVYSLLTGRPPFEGESPEETVELVRHAFPTRPKEYQPAIPDEVQAVVLRMLAKRPEERYSVPGPLLADLEIIPA